MCGGRLSESSPTISIEGGGDGAKVTVAWLLDTVAANQLADRSAYEAPTPRDVSPEL